MELAEATSRPYELSLSKAAQSSSIKRRHLPSVVHDPASTDPPRSCPQVVPACAANVTQCLACRLPTVLKEFIGTTTNKQAGMLGQLQANCLLGPLGPSSDKILLVAEHLLDQQGHGSEMEPVFIFRLLHASSDGLA